MRLLKQRASQVWKLRQRGGDELAIASAQVVQIFKIGKRISVEHGLVVRADETGHAIVELNGQS